MGNAMEWYDYGVFTAGAITATTGAQFFPGSGNAVLKSFVLLAASFLVRPSARAVRPSSPAAGVFRSSWRCRSA
jgi:hypothetical protein